MKQHNKIYKAGLYCRLSKDDDLQTESMSILTQKSILTAFAKENGFLVYDFYVDDGFSGTNFERPNFKRMIEDIESGLIDMVITKDLSRLGRDYLQTGHYIERYFPSVGVRYIAVGDNIDTGNDSPENDFIMPFKNIFNEHFARESSRKAKAALRSKATNGEYLSHAPYGYIKDPNTHNKLIVDEKAKPYIVKIFELAASGLGYNKIANTLRDSKIPIASAYKQWHKGLSYDKDPFEWDLTIVKGILQNEVYLGHIFYGKRKKLSFKDKKLVKTPENEWIKTYNTHEAIISQELWDNAHSKINSRKRVTSTGETHLFSGLLKCSDCGRTLALSKYTQKSGQKQFLCCITYKKRGKRYCNSHYITFKALESVILADIRKHTVLAQTDEQKLIEILNKQNGNRKSKEILQAGKELKKLIKRDNELDGVFMKIYEDKLNGILPESRFLDISKKYEKEQAEVKTKIDTLTGFLQTHESNTQNAQDFTRLIKEYTDINQLSKEILNALIDKIVVGNRIEINGEVTQEIEIFYKFVGNIA